MSNENEKKPLHLSGAGSYGSKNVSAGQIRQSFSHGRSKIVAVELKKKRVFSPGAEGTADSRRVQPGAAPSAEEIVQTSAALAGLTGEERSQRLQALQTARRAAEEEARRKAEEDARRPVVEPVVEEEAQPAEAASESDVSVAKDAEEAASEEAVTAPAVQEASALDAGSPKSREAETVQSDGGKAKETTANALATDRTAAKDRPLIAPMTGVPLRPAMRSSLDAASRRGGDKKTTGSLGAASGGAATRGTAAKSEAPRRDGGRSGERGGSMSAAPAVEASGALSKEGVRFRPSSTPAMFTEDDEDKSKGPGKAAARTPAKKADDGKRRGKLTINDVLSDEEGQRGRSKAAILRAAQKERRKAQQQQVHEKVVREVVVPDTITVQELANRMAERAPNVIKALMKLGVMATINQGVDADTAELVAQEFGHTVKRVSEADIEDNLSTGPDDESLMAARPPVVTVMGHVDHGKTSLLDALRETNVVSGEAGGITQHIGAYQVRMPTGKRITFIDTPGHEAFTAMRARGARVTDIVVLVVAADDGIMPQTVEAVRHAQAAGVPIIVAINKIDKPSADPARVRTDLLQHGVVVETLGGDVLAVEVSAKNRLHLDKLEEAILLQAEMLDLKANPSHAAEGAVVEAKMEKGRGAVATILIRRGTLHVGDLFVVGKAWGRVRAMLDDKGERVVEAGPAMPVEILGLQGVPAAGDELIVVADEARARDVAAYRQRKEREMKAVKSARGTMEQMMADFKAGEVKELPLIVKADVQGSVEALIGTLEKLGGDAVRVKILHADVGAINESDITLAKASTAMVAGFNVRANPQARDMARRDGVDIRYYSIIYDLAEDMKRALTGMLAPTFSEKIIGYAEIREVFSISKIGKVAGCMVTEGVIKRGCKVRLLRDNVVIHEGELGQLKRFKDDAKEVREGFECGMSFASYHGIQVKDMVECFEMEEVAGEL